jgi:hypothetical protein
MLDKLIFGVETLAKNTQTEAPFKLWKSLKSYILNE